MLARPLYKINAALRPRLPFSARYTGSNSLIARHEKGYTFSATAYLGLRPWRDAEIYWNPEAVQGIRCRTCLAWVD